MLKLQTVVAVDYDGTIAHTNEEKVKWIREHLGLEVASWQCNRTDCVPLIGAAAYDAMGDWLYEREGTLLTPAAPGAVNALRRLSKHAALHLVTARPEGRLVYAREWLAAMGVLACFQGLHSAAVAPKSEVCRKIGARVLIDDDRRHLAAVDAGGLHRILLHHGSDRTPGGLEGMTFCRSWSAVVRCIERLPGYAEDPGTG